MSTALIYLTMAIVSVFFAGFAADDESYQHFAIFVALGVANLIPVVMELTS